MTIDLILGTAGHIDHGKTSLIRALTGVDTDRLPEEKRRGITIELGFAQLDLAPYRLGIVDVPGHERFVRNMLAGAVGMDVALLLVAADDSIKQQTREHLEILRLLDLKAGVIVITKIDLADPDWIDMVEEEVRELTVDTFLANAPIVRTSVQTGEGIDDLKRALQGAAKIAAEARGESDAAVPFRMPIDRTFTIAGHGTVVTGSVSSGSASIGDELVIEPGGVVVRVRGLQNHDETVSEVRRGQRAAINLAGVHHDATRRGQELATPGSLPPSRLLTARLDLLPGALHPLKNRARVRLHLGAAEVLASVRLLDTERLEQGGSALAQFFLAEPVVATWNQPYVVRSESPVATIGGGRVLDPNAVKIRHVDGDVLPMLAALESADTIERASAALYFAGLRAWQPNDLLRTAGVADGESAAAALAERGDLLTVQISPTRVMRIHRKTMQDLCGRIEGALGKLHDANPLRIAFDRARLASRFAYLDNAEIFAAALASLVKQGRVRLNQSQVGRTDRGPKLSQNERKLLVELVEMFRTAGLESPTPKQCQQSVARNQQAVPQLLKLAIGNGDLVAINDNYYLHADVERQVRETLSERMADGEGLTLSQIRELLETTRKYAVPLCEYFDRIGVTRREGDLRVLATTDSS